MKITKDNCEAFFLDYHEGVLSPEMVAEVLLFIEQNPDFRSEFEGFESFNISDPDLSIFEHKEALKRVVDFSSDKITIQNADEFFIAEVEGLLSQKVLADLDAFILKNPELEQSRKLYSATKLQSDSSVLFDNKNLLYQKSIPVGLATSETIDELLIKDLEFVITPAEKADLHEYLKYNTEAVDAQKLYSKTILIPDNDVVFPAKSQLKQVVALPRRSYYSVLSIAASIALLIGFYFLMFDKQTTRLDEKKNNLVEIRQKNSNQKSTIPSKNKDLSSSNQTQSVLASNIANPGSRFEQRGNQTDNSNAVSAANQQPQNQADIRLTGEIAYIQPLMVSNLQANDYVDPNYMFIRLSAMYVNQYNEYYYNLKLADELQYAEFNSKDKNPEKTIYKAIAGSAENKFAALLDRPHRETTPLNGWLFAELGVKTYNSITGSDVELKLQKDDEGKVMSYGIESSVMNFERETRASKSKEE